MRHASSLTVPLALLVLSPVARLAAAAATTASSLRMQPATVPLGMTYHGLTVHAEGVAPADRELALVCTGQASELTLKKKEKVLGLLWLKRGEVHFADVPLLYFLNTSAELSQLAPPEVLAGFGVGYAAVEQKAVGQAPAENQDHRWFGELLKLKEREQLFALDDHGVRLQQRAGQAHWSADLRLPAKLSPGDYDVRLVGFRAGAGELLAEQVLEVRQVGAVAALHSLAEEHGLLYGIGAVIIALAVGLLTGMVFGLGSKGGH